MMLLIFTNFIFSVITNNICQYNFFLQTIKHQKMYLINLLYYFLNYYDKHLSVAITNNSTYTINKIIL